MIYRACRNLRVSLKMSPLNLFMFLASLLKYPPTFLLVAFFNQKERKKRNLENLSMKLKNYYTRYDKFEISCSIPHVSGTFVLISSPFPLNYLNEMHF